MLSRLRREPGQDLIEYALVMPIILLLLFSILQCVLIIFSYNTISDAAREGARSGAVAGDQSADQSYRKSVAADEARIVTEAANLNQDAAYLTITPTFSPSLDGGGSLGVEVLYRMDVFAWISGSQITLRAVSTKKIEID